MLDLGSRVDSARKDYDREESRHAANKRDVQFILTIAVLLATAAVSMVSRGRLVGVSAPAFWGLMVLYASTGVSLIGVGLCLLRALWVVEWKYPLTAVGYLRWMRSRADEIIADGYGEEVAERTAREDVTRYVAEDYEHSASANQAANIVQQTWVNRAVKGLALSVAPRAHPGGRVDLSGHPRGVPCPTAASPTRPPGLTTRPRRPTPHGCRARCSRHPLRRGLRSR